MADGAVIQMQRSRSLMENLRINDRLRRRGMAPERPTWESVTIRFIPKYRMYHTSRPRLTLVK